jgi:putative peptidoglycan lipid II flippase
LFLWSAQAIYARAFYAAQNTFVPMAAATIVTAASLPIYAVFYHWQGAMGLAIASDIGIALQTGTIALLLHRRQMVSLASLDYSEMGRCLLAGLTSGVAAWMVIWGMGGVLGHMAQSHGSAHMRWIDLGQIVAGTAVWLVAAMWVLHKAGSALPRVMMKRLGLA